MRNEEKAKAKSDEEREAKLRQEEKLRADEKLREDEEAAEKLRLQKIAEQEKKERDMLSWE